jgi:hypothetical protein
MFRAKQVSSESQGHIELCEERMQSLNRINEEYLSQMKTLKIETEMLRTRKSAPFTEGLTSQIWLNSKRNSKSARMLLKPPRSLVTYTISWSKTWSRVSHLVRRD